MGAETTSTAAMRTLSGPSMPRGDPGPGPPQRPPPGAARAARNAPSGTRAAMIVAMTSTATEQLAALDELHAQAVERRRGFDLAERQAHEAVRAAEHEVQRLLGDRSRGLDVDRSLSAAMKALDRARGETRREWALERAAGDQIGREAAAATPR
jgi:hypothetical protein